MASTTYKFLVLVAIGVASGDYYEDLQAPASNQLSFPGFNGRVPAGSRNRRINGNGGTAVAGGRSPDTAPTSGSSLTAETGGGLVGSGSSIDERVGSKGNGFGTSVGSDVRDPITVLGEAIGGGGVPGEDYPILSSSVPITGFSCEGQLPGYYADTSGEARCQVFHICQDGGRMDSFLCSIGTIFNQQYFVCDWWYNFDCSTTEGFYELNAEFGHVSAAAAAGGRSEFNGFGSASTLQGSFASITGSNVLGGAPSTQYGAPDRGNDNRIASRGNDNRELVNGRRNTFDGGDRFGASSDQRISVSDLIRLLPSRGYGTPRVNGGVNVGASTNVVLTNRRRKNGNGSRNGDYKGSTIQIPSGLYQTPN